MTRNQIIEKLVAVFAELGVRATADHLDGNFQQNLQLSEGVVFDFLLQLEEVFGIDIKEEELAELKLDIVGFIDRKLPDVNTPRGLEDVGSKTVYVEPAESNSAATGRPCPTEPLPPSHSRGNFTDDETTAAADDVDCTVFAPPAVQPGGEALIQVFAHLPEQANEAEEEALEFDEDAKRRGVASLGSKIKRGSTLTFELIMRHVSIDDPVQTLTWQGQSQSVQFGVEIPDDAKLGTRLGKVIVSQDSVPIGRITFKLEILANPTPVDERPVPAGTSVRFQNAFVSYASADRAEVLRRVQMLKAVGITFFQDVIDLDPGQRWEQELYRHIDDCEVLLLFWSTNAKESPWVTKEWEYALQKKGQDAVLPIPIEGPPVVPPPDALAHLHFNDSILYFLPR